MPSFKSVQPQSDSEEEEEAVDSMMKTSASDVDLSAAAAGGSEGVRQRPITRSAAKRSGLSQRHDQGEEDSE